MGTSHRHKPGVKGEPNWGNASAAVTGVAGAVEESEALDNNPPANLSPAQIAKKQSALGKRISTGYHHAVRNLVRAAGGRGKVTSGSSRAIGHAGIYVAGSFSSVFNEIANNGLVEWLRQKGIYSLDGKSCHDIIDIIKQYIDTGIAGMDETAANNALECVMDYLEERMSDDLDSFDEIMSRIVAGDELKDMFDLFFGMYIYIHLSQDFEEKLEYERGTVAMKNAMDEIKDQILDDIRSARSGRSVTAIDWGSSEGDAFIKTEFDRILFILQGHED